ncbi:Eco57I restriction-modification methylase domain-containing protein [Lignipirellula cremea]|uniref:Eco57I restriction-modification methylase domain-containing protein n=1 Tax=Lignipirellula cremea TaxID=2528010 RepID=UPI0018D2072D|nr:N-6 DNA methylase [Lignipirellula cremea]
MADIFIGLLGYTGPAGQDRYTIGFERHVQVDGKYADAVLGEFNGHQHYVVALEGKGPRDPLERPYAGRRMSAVDQGYRYAINLPCDWIIVTSIRQTRLYHKGSDQQTYERFDTEELASDEAALRRFLFLLGADRVTPAAGKCHFYRLLAESEQVGRELTKEFYINYANMRQDAFEQLSRDNPDAPRQEVLSSTQKLLDRILFVAFSEDRGLLPADSIKSAYEHRDPYNPRPIWANFRGLFTAINSGNQALGIHAYNGGLFADDPALDTLQVSDDVCRYFRELGSYDYRPAHLATGEGRGIDVDILGHIFEQSITDLERLRNELEGRVEPQGAEKHKTRRKKEGAFYTPAFITRYIIEQAVGGVLADRLEQLRVAHQKKASGTAKAALAEPGVYELDTLSKPANASLVAFWEAWQDELATFRVLDPACGSGAFLIEAFDQLHATYEQSNDRLAELRGYRTLFDLDKRILENNLYGVDLNEEAIEICRLSLWIKTAAQGKALTSLDHSIRVGNSVVADPTVHPRAIDWQATFPEVFAQGGFDVVVGNPPYVRQEWFTEYKPYLQANYAAYHGMADLYVYFYELGLRVLKQGGLLSYIVTNKWMKAGYGEPLRRLFTEKAWVESVVDFGHAKQIFADADVFPSIIVARKPTQEAKPEIARLCTIPREQLKVDDLSRQIDTEGFELPQKQLGADSWQLEPSLVTHLMAKLRESNVPLSQFVGSKPLTGIKTAFNQAYLIDGATRDALVFDDPNCGRLIEPYVRGADIGRWGLENADYWMIVIPSSGDYAWPWAESGSEAENVFETIYPSIFAHMKRHEVALRKRSDCGRYWWELRSCAYWDSFKHPKIYYQLIQFHPCYALDSAGVYGNNKTAFILSDDLYLLAVLNSPLMWWHNWRFLAHMKDEALAPNPTVLENIPIAAPTPIVREKAACAVLRQIQITNAYQAMRRTILDWLRVEHSVIKPSLRLQSPTSLDSDAFVAEVKKIRGKKNPLSAAALKSLRDEHAQTIEPARVQAMEALQLERQLSDLVNEAYGLTPAEVALMWKTAPPRMPVGN